VTKSLTKSRSLLLVAIPAMLLACDDPTSPPNPPVGNYTALIFVTTPTGGSARNELLAGSTLSLSLKSNGTTSGHLHLAANGSDPPFDADMAGTWTMNGDVVEFTQPADTFVKDMAFFFEPLTARVWHLVGDDVFDETRINLTLTTES
jgi:hypothetical protein